MIAHAEASYTPGWKGEIPALPVELTHVWDAFGFISRRRQVGMEANPLSLTEIEAYCRLVDQNFTPLDVELLCALDDAVLATAKAKPTTSAQTTDATDTDGVRSLMRGMGAKPTPRPRKTKPATPIKEE